MSTIALLVIGGGGGGGYRGGGGGGAGEYIYNSSFSTDTDVYTVTIGNGGAGGTSEPDHGKTGGNSVFGDVTALGGGGGGSGTTRNGYDGGSGGGANQSGTIGSSVASQGVGYDGGLGYTSGCYGGGAGGGAGAVGANGSSTNGGNGGAGVSSSITGSAVTRAGGGGAGTIVNGTAGTASGGGGAGSNSGSGSNATDNTGGGGGGGYATSAGGAGGKGVVIIRYLTSDFGTCTGGTTSTDGSYTVHIFNSSGTFTLVFLSQIKKLMGVEQSSIKKFESIFNTDISPMSTDANLQFYMRFQNNWNDSSANAYNLTASNSPTFVTGKVSKAGNFVAASSQKATKAISGMGNLAITTTQSWSFWINVPTLSDNNYIFGISDGNYWFVLTSSTGHCTFNTGMSVSLDVAGLTNGVWSHVVFTYDSTAGHICSYLNGVINQNNVDVTGTFTKSGSTFGLGNIGDYAGYGTFLIDELMMFNDILTQAEVTKLSEYGRYIKKVSGVSNV